MDSNCYDSLSKPYWLSRRKENEEKFKQISKAPILERTNEEPFGTGSVCVIKEEKKMENVVYMLFRVGRFFKVN